MLGNLLRWLLGDESRAGAAGANDPWSRTFRGWDV
jgi:hypothetical protein